MRQHHELSQTSWLEARQRWRCSRGWRSCRHATCDLNAHKEKLLPELSGPLNRSNKIMKHCLKGLLTPVTRLCKARYAMKRRRPGLVTVVASRRHPLAAGCRSSQGLPPPPSRSLLLPPPTPSHPVRRHPGKVRLSLEVSDARLSTRRRQHAATM